MKCNDCRERGACIVELDPRYAHLCAKAARGTASDLAQIRALTARRGSTPAPEPPPAAEAAPAEFPPLVAQVAGLVGTLASWARSGFPVADAAERRRRLAICLACPLLDRPRGRCKACGCMARAKPWIGSAKCPLGKWESPRPS